MICQVCGKKTATTHIKTIVNGKLTQYHLCADCAREKGYGNLFGGWGSELGSLLGGLLGERQTGAQAVRCEKCGATFDEIMKTGKVGCPHCYTAFRRQLLPVVQRIHGTTRHTGKSPRSSALVISGGGQMMPVEESPLEEKKRLLKKAVEAQEFEKAAALRDEIRAMEGRKGEGQNG